MEAGVMLPPCGILYNRMYDSTKERAMQRDAVASIRVVHFCRLLRTANRLMPKMTNKASVPQTIGVSSKSFLNMGILLCVFMP